MKRKLEKSGGITLVALVVTIVVLLILAGITISYVMGDNSIFKKAQEAKEQMAIAKAREKLELVLNGALMQKYSEGLTDEQLTDKINEIGEELPKEKPEYPELQNVIVDGYMFEIDRSVPKIVDYIGPADGVIITANISGNNGWLKPGEASVMVTGKIKTYSGGTIVSATATSNGTSIADFSINGEEYTITNITEDTTIVITAKDSNNKEATKTIPVTIKIDNIPPTVDSVTAMADELKIKFSATGHDNESGLKHFSYTISPKEGLPEDKATGTFMQGQEVEITSTTETAYTIEVKAIDNCDNITEVPKIESVQTEKITLTVDQEVVYLGMGDTKKVTATIEATNIRNKELEWLSNNSEIAEVSQDGIITGKKVGTTTIIVRSKGNNNKFCSITVKVGEVLDLDTIPLELVSGDSTAIMKRSPLLLSVGPGDGRWGNWSMTLPAGVSGVQVDCSPSGPVNGSFGLCIEYTADDVLTQSRLFWFASSEGSQWRNYGIVNVPSDVEKKLVAHLFCRLLERLCYYTSI